MLSNHANKAHFAAEELLTALDALHRELDTAELPGVTACIADYAWNGYAFRNDNELLEALHLLSSVDELCGANLMSPNGDELFSGESKSLLRQLANAAHARRDLDNGDSIRVEGLAALARVAEKTVRMATNPARPGSIRVRKEGHWAFIDAPDALEWLRRRDDFQLTCKQGDTMDQPLIADASDLQSTCRHWREHKKMDVDALANTLGWTAPQRNAYKQLESSSLTDQMTRFPPQALLALGECLGMPQPEDFARQAFRVLAAGYAEYLADRQLTNTQQ